jgi:hypothetical protein
MNMTRILLFSLLMSSSALYAQETFPVLKGETPNGQNVELPKDGEGTKTIVGLAYSKKAEAALEAWYEPAYLRFVKKHGLFAATYEAHLYFVPMFVGANKAAYGPSMKKIQKSAEPAVLDHVLFFKGELSDYEGTLGLEEKSKPYFFVLDENGLIIYRTSGEYTDEKLEEIEGLLMD